MFEQKFSVIPGQQIEITAGSIKVSGTVATVNHWGQAGWQIEVMNANVPGGYAAWKQWQDGGEITKLDGKTIKRVSRLDTVIADGSVICQAYLASISHTHLNPSYEKDLLDARTAASNFLAGLYERKTTESGQVLYIRKMLKPVIESLYTTTSNLDLSLPNHELLKSGVDKALELTKN
jgi:hypothetical protein